MDENNLVEEYITTALLALMKDKDYNEITVTDIAKKAGVSRLTYYRRFKSKEDVIIKYFENQLKEFSASMRYKPRCKEDFYESIFTAFSLLKKHKEFMQLLISAHIEHLYIDLLNKSMSESFPLMFNTSDVYAPYFFAGALYNVSFAWLKNDCADSVKSVTDSFFKLTFNEKQTPSEN